MTQLNPAPLTVQPLQYRVAPAVEVWPKVLRLVAWFAIVISLSRVLSGFLGLWLYGFLGAGPYEFPRPGRSGDILRILTQYLLPIALGTTVIVGAAGILARTRWGCLLTQIAEWITIGQSLIVSCLIGISFGRPSSTSSIMLNIYQAGAAASYAISNCATSLLVIAVPSAYRRSIGAADASGSA